MAHACNIRKKNEDKADDINTRTYINETQNLGDTYIHKYNIIIILNEDKFHNVILFLVVFLAKSLSYSLLLPRSVQASTREQSEACVFHVWERSLTF